MEKKTRKVNKPLLEVVKRLMCLACGGGPSPSGISGINYKNYPIRSDADHITTRGAGGGDEWDNVWPLCRKHHQERHFHGLRHMAEKYNECRRWLEISGRIDVLDRIGL